MASPSLSVQLLSSIEAWRGHEQVDLGPQKQRAVFAILALRANERVGTDEILASVWGIRRPPNASGILHTYIARLRRAVEPESPPRRRTNIIESTPGGYRLAVDAGRVDLLRCRQLMAEAEASIQLGKRRLALGLLAKAMRGWRGDCRSELAELLQTREAVDQLHFEWIDAGLRFVTLGLEEGQAAAVLSTAERLALAEPLHEVINARYLLTLASTGQRAAAIAWYRELRDQLRAELGVEPCPELAAAYRLVISDGGRPGRPDPGPPARRPGPRPWRGPGPPVSRIVGREAESAQLRSFTIGQRLLTLTGPAGVGKSALAMSVCDVIRDEFPNGVTVVHLSEARNDTDVCRRLLAAMAAPPVAAADPPTHVAALLRTRRMLLLLDNADRVLDVCARLVERLVPFCAGLTVMLTSRELLGLPYEAVWPVKPLPVPPTAASGARQLPQRTAALELFERRAIQADPGFRTSASNAAMVTSICSRMAGLPLLLELAAAQLRILGLAQVERMVRDQPERLVAHRRASPAHHRSFDQALQWTYPDLSADEKLLLAKLGEIGPRLRAEDVVRHVATTSPLAPVTADFCLSRLADKSWVQPDRATDGQCYTILEPLLHFARRLSRPTAGVRPPALQHSLSALPDRQLSRNRHSSARTPPPQPAR